MIALDVSHNMLLVIASLAVSLMAGFTGLSLTKGASALPVPARKVRIAMAAVALGGGIWAMHFVAMLGLQLPIAFFYDTLITLISALVAILIVGVALLILHFWPRTRLTITLAGIMVGIGIPVMHYIGMSGMQLCRPSYTIAGIAEAGLISLALSLGAIWVAYGERTHRNIILGTLCFGVAVFAVHFVAMAGTSFFQLPDAAVAGPAISNEALALVVSIIAFVICGAFLMSTVTFLPVPQGDAIAVPEPDPEPAPAAPERSVTVPYELDGKTMFIDCTEVQAVRAEGHYTILYAQDRKYFCPWSISEAESRLPSTLFVRAHRSYLINPAHVSSFERKKDNGVLFFDAASALEKVPVSRSRLGTVREALGLT